MPTLAALLIKMAKALGCRPSELVQAMEKLLPPEYFSASLAPTLERKP